jgi:hypothetical protein
MPLKLAMIVLRPLCMACVVLRLVGVSWQTTAEVAVALVIFVALIGLRDRLRQLPSPWQQQEPAAMAVPPQEAVLGLGTSAIASLPVYRYNKKTGGAGDECSICLGEVKPKETVKRSSLSARTCSTKGASTCGCGPTGPTRCAGLLLTRRLLCRRFWRLAYTLSGRLRFSALVIVLTFLLLLAIQFDLGSVTVGIS